MFFTPKWVKLLPSHLRHENKDKMRELENLRTQYDIPHEGFAMIMMPPIDKVKTIYPILIGTTNEDHSTILKEFESIGIRIDEDGPEATSILYEILYFYLHLADRVANEYLGTEREEFIDNLVEENRIF